MKLNIKYFASVRETIGLDGEVIDMPQTQGVSIDDVCEHLKGCSDAHASALSHPHLKAALNQTLCEFSARVQGGDELAFFPPVTGG